MNSLNSRKTSQPNKSGELRTAFSKWFSGNERARRFLLHGKDQHCINFRIIILFYLIMLASGYAFYYTLPHEDTSPER